MARALEGGDKLEAYLRRVADGLNQRELSVGFMEEATYPDGTPVASVAFWNEYGHGGRFHAPPRPFFRTMIAAESPTWGAKAAAMLKSTGYNVDQTLSMLGEDISGALGQSITEMNNPPLSPTTLVLRARFGNNPHEIRARDAVEAARDAASGATGATGSQAKPLVWTGHMLNSITYKVE
jgi:hypothetical protein